MSAVTDLSDPLCLVLLSTHPNQLHPSHAIDLGLPTEATPLELIHAYTTGSFSATIPAPIRNLISSIRTTQLPRNPVSLPAPNVPPISIHGMSPKKHHEVLRMASYIASLASQFSSPLHIVDIGAGQGYLTRTLKILLPSAHILALDADEAQSVGAQRWEARLLPHADPPIAHRVIFITPDSLLQTLDDWTSSTSNGNENPVPILFVALHACGSLTPAILRAYISASQKPKIHPRWYPAALVAVGCCYNLMDPSDYPESTKHLPISAYHLAAQIPGTWLLQTDPAVLDPAVQLAIRKVTWRAMLNTALEHAMPITASPSASPLPTPAPQNKSATVPARWNRRPAALSSSSRKKPDEENGIGVTPHLLRLGKLRDSAYKTWNGFLDAAGERMGVIFREEDYEDEIGNRDGHENGNDDHHPDDKDEYQHQQNEQRQRCEGETMSTTSRHRSGRDPSFENMLGVLHVLRCFLGPVVESVILRDRVAWVREGLGLGLGSALASFPSPSPSPDPATVPSPGSANVGDVGNDKKNVNSDSDAPRAQKQMMRVEVVNLFDQATGSGRNVAIVIAPERVEGVFLTSEDGGKPRFNHSTSSDP